MAFFCEQEGHMLRRRVLRLGLPGVAGVFALVAAAVTPSLTSAQTPLLEQMSPNQLIGAVMGAAPVQYSGTLATTSNLLGPASSLLSSLGKSSTLPQGTSTEEVYRGPGHDFRVQVLDAQSERDLYVNSRAAWLWSSSGSLAEEIVGSSPAHTGSTLNPTEMADRIVAALSPTSTLSVGANTYVGGQAAYDLTVTPNQSGSMVKRVNIYVDATNYQVLGFQIMAVGSSTPALSVEYSQISFAAQPASLFDFAPPKGSTVKTVKLPLVMGGSSFSSKILGTSWDSVAEMPEKALTQMLGVPAASSLGELETPVKVGGVAAELLRTTLVNALILPNQKVFAGAVRPSVLEADALAGMGG